MKRVRIHDRKVDVTVDITWDNELMDDCAPLQLKRGDSLSVHYRNYKDRYTYETIPVYTTLYHPQEILDSFKKRNPVLEKLIKQFDLDLTV